MASIDEDCSESSASSVDFNDLTDWHVDRVIDACSNEHVEFIYRFRKYISRGQFGTVSRIISIRKECLAVKEVNHSKVKLPEVKIMTQLSHPNLIRVAYFYTKKTTPNRYKTYIFMEFMPQTLHDVVTEKIQVKEKFSHVMCAAVMYQILRGLAYMHHRSIAHRDIKPRNVLIHMKKMKVKLCDFGAAQNIENDSANVAYICSRWYRAPELLLLNRFYTCAVDLWSAGCILGEMLKLQPLFVGSDTVDQLATIRDVIGAPTEDELKAMKPSCQYNLFPQPARKHIRGEFNSEIPDSVVELLNSLLQYDPAKRPHAWTALGEPMFDILRSKDYGLTKFPHLFNFTSEELEYNPQLNSKLIPQ